MPEIFKKNKSFTLIELAVVAAIIILLSSLLFANYREGQKQFSFSQEVQKLAQDLRRTQEMAMGGKELPTAFGGGFPRGGYGVHFQKNSNFYIIFADCNNNKKYDGAGLASNCAIATQDQPYPEQIEKIFLNKGVKISDVSTPSHLDITFFPPDPIITIDPTGSLAIITLALEGKTKTVTINISGMVDID